MFQRITIIGRLGRDAEMKLMQSGEHIVTFSVATDRTYKRDGQQQKETTWFRVQIFGKLGEALNPYLTKGTMIVAEGRLITDPQTGGPKVFQRKDGGHSAMFEIVADQVRLLGGGERNAPTQSPTQSPTSGTHNDDMPF